VLNKLAELASDPELGLVQVVAEPVADVAVAAVFRHVVAGAAAALQSSVDAVLLLAGRFPVMQVPLPERTVR
jgi:hypothetical protein